MSKASLQTHPHRRFNPLTGMWLIVSPQRATRPWAGQQEKAIASNPDDCEPHIDPKNPLSPGAVRSSGIRNENYNSVYVFENDFPALVDCKEGADDTSEEDDIFRTRPAPGSCFVFCFHPHSNLTLATMSHTEVLRVLEKWRDLVREQAPQFTWVQIFENRGEIMGCSNPHPHCQIWSSKFLPQEPSVKDERQLNYFQRHGQPLLVDYLRRELEENHGERVLCENSHWVCLVPFWAQWPFETMLLPRRHVLRFYDLHDHELESLAEIMQRLLTIYDNLFHCSFPYSMAWIGAPTGPEYLARDCSHWQLHAQYYPPLLRSATVKKFIAGYELFAETQRDLTPETAVKILRSVDASVHYTKIGKAAIGDDANRV